MAALLFTARMEIRGINPYVRVSVAKRAWTMLTPSRKKEIVRYLAALKSDEARERNVSRALRVLSGAKERFMARSW